MGDRFPLPVKMGRVDERAFPLAELTGHHHLYLACTLLNLPTTHIDLNRT